MVLWDCKRVERGMVYCPEEGCLISCILYWNRKQKASFQRLLKFCSEPSLISFLFSFLKVVLQLKWWNSDQQYLLVMSPSMIWGKNVFAAKWKGFGAVKYWSQKTVMTKWTTNPSIKIINSFIYLTQNIKINVQLLLELKIYRHLEDNHLQHVPYLFW